MPRCIPSYLLLSRHGIYYFRLRLPKLIDMKTGRSRRELRVSLRTRCQRVALARARALWVYLHSATTRAPCCDMKGAPRMNLVITDDTLSLLEHHQRRGKQLYQWWQALEKRLGDEELFDVFEKLSEFDQNALDYFGQCLAGHQAGLTLARTELSGEARAPLGAGKVREVPLARYEEPQDDNNVPLQLLIDRFVESKRGHTKAAARSYTTVLSLFIRIVGEISERAAIRSGELEAAHVREYVSILRKWPTHARFVDASSIQEIVETQRRKLSRGTINNHFMIVRMFLGWVETQQYTVVRDLGKILKAIKTGTKGQRLCFTDAELLLLFESDEYRTGQFARDSEYWVPLIALFTGARQAEICQLHTTDVTYDETHQHWFIDINAHGNKTLKTENAARRIPVHPRLITLGFADFVTSAAERKALFPEEIRNARGEFKGFSDRFNRYRKKKGVLGERFLRKDFHSFRHTVVQKMTSQGAESYLAEWFVGHKSSHASQTLTVYSHGASEGTLIKCLDYLDYVIDFAKIRRWSPRSRARAKRRLLGVDGRR